MPVIDLAGRRFGRLLALSYCGSQDGRKAWKCQCDCGAVIEVPGANLRAGKAQSCGCLKRENLAAGINTKHGMYKSRTHKTWESMVSRCTNENDPSYSAYGGRGITVCARWMQFEFFHIDMGDRPAGMTIDRIDVAGNYEPANCRWATAVTQANNRRVNRRVSYRGVAYTVRELSTLTGAPYATLRERILKAGWDAEKAVSTPVAHKRKAA